MRLIDADELKETISEESCRRFVRWDKTIIVAEFETFVRDVIDNAPAVEPERTQCNQIVWEQGYECGYHQAKEDVIRRIKEQYNEHHELIPYWLSVGDVRGGTE